MKRTSLSRLVILGLSSGFMIIIGGCGAAHTAIKKRTLDVQTKMSETIFLEPTSADKKIVFVDIRNTSDQEILVKDQVLESLRSHGYMITDDPSKANFMLQANILQIGKRDLRSAQSAVDSGFGGAVAGAAIGISTHNSSSNAAVGGLIGAALGVVGDALVDDTFYSMITDIQIRERPSSGQWITQSQIVSMKQGSAGTIKLEIGGGNTDWKTYRTRIVSTANKMNLEFEEAKPALESALARSLSALF